MNVLPCTIPGLLVIEPRVFRDERGFFLEPYNRPRYTRSGIAMEFVQDNHSFSRYGTLRGLHYQSHPGQDKLVRVVRGRIWDVAVDIRPDSPTFGRWHAEELDDRSHRQFFVPIGFAHGFVVLSEEAEVLYKCSAPYDATTECGIAWDDPELAVTWPVTDPVLSGRDRSNPSFQELRAKLKI